MHPRVSNQRYDFFDKYFTGDKVPSNEDNKNHANGISKLDAGMKIAGVKVIEKLYPLEPRLAFDADALVQATWGGFKYAGPYDIKYASNGVHGMKVVDKVRSSYVYNASSAGARSRGVRAIKATRAGAQRGSIDAHCTCVRVFTTTLVNVTSFSIPSLPPPSPPVPSLPTKLLEKHATIDVLGVMMMDSVFSAHLTYDNSTSLKVGDKQYNEHFHLDLSSLEKYTPLPRYAKLGGKATFVWDQGDEGFAKQGEKARLPRMRTASLDYGGKSYVPKDDDAEVNEAYAKSTLVGWRFAEKAIIASLLSMTNLVMHVKDLHLEVRKEEGRMYKPILVHVMSKTFHSILPPFVFFY